MSLQMSDFKEKQFLSLLNNNLNTIKPLYVKEDP